VLAYALYWSLSPRSISTPPLYTGGSPRGGVCGVWVCWLVWGVCGVVWGGGVGVGWGGGVGVSEMRVWFNQWIPSDETTTFFRHELFQLLLSKVGFLVYIQNLHNYRKELN